MQESQNGLTPLEIRSGVILVMSRIKVPLTSCSNILTLVERAYLVWLGINFYVFSTLEGT
jgi:hypothetical protein